MKRVNNPKLMPLVQSFFDDYLRNQFGASHHTIRSYRDALRLFFCFLSDTKGCSVSELQLEDIKMETVKAFLVHLETKRANTASSRNYRLTAIRSFCKHLIRHDIERANQYHRVLALPLKRTHSSPAHYLEPEDVRLILKQPDRRTVLGTRDYALLLFIYNTGARVSEALAVCVKDLSLTAPNQVKLHGKLNKDRLCPLWPETVNALKKLPTVRDGRRNDHIFCNRNGNSLTRDGVAYILKKHALCAAHDAPVLRRKKIAPHLLRHSCAVALLQAGVDVTVIRDYLGHASIATTSRYLSTNLQMKQEALEVFWKKSGISPGSTSHWKPGPDLLTYLDSL